MLKTHPWNLFWFLPNPFISYQLINDCIVKKFLWITLSEMPVDGATFSYSSNIKGLFGFGDVEISSSSTVAAMAINSIFLPGRFVSEAMRCASLDAKAKHTYRYAFHFWLLAPLLLGFGLYCALSALFAPEHLVFPLPETLLKHQLFVGFTLIVWGLIINLCVAGASEDPLYPDHYLPVSLKEIITLSLKLLGLFSLFWMMSYYIFGWVLVCILAGVLTVVAIFLLLYISSGSIQNLSQ